VARARSLDEALTFLRTLDPATRLVLPPGVELVNVPVLDGITLDSSEVAPGDLFAGLPGARRHGAEYTADAAAAGAVALLTDRASPVLPTLVVSRPRRLLGPLASWLHGEPSALLDVHGVTGTNGKTSTVHLIAAGFRAAGRCVGWAGSLELRAGDRVRSAERTTVEAPAVQEYLACTRDAGASDVALEVSSHGLALDRLGGVNFRTAVFTNLSSDHLDLHGDLEDYYASKASLFTPDRCGLAVIGIDGAAGRGWPQRPAAPSSPSPPVDCRRSGRPATCTPGSPVRGSACAAPVSTRRCGCDCSARTRSTTRWPPWPSSLLPASMWWTQYPASRRRRCCRDGWNGSTWGSRS